MVDLKEEIVYCVRCGAINKKSSATCSECKADIHKKISPFVDYVKRHTKDALQDYVIDTIYGAVKKYLVSHLYGIVLTVSVVVSTTAIAYNPVPYIKNVEQRPPIIANAEEVQEEVAKIGEEDMKYLGYMIADYQNYMWCKEEYFEGGEDLPGPGEAFADLAIGNYNYPAVHETQAYGIKIGDIADQMADERAANGGSHHTSYYDLCNPYSFLYNEDVKSDLAKQLYADGYQVAEGDFSFCIHGDEIDMDAPPQNPDEKRSYHGVFVMIDDNWYIAEDRLI